MKLLERLFRLDGRTIVVAGGSGQIGFAFCEILADCGATVVIADIDTELGEGKRAALPGRLAERMRVVHADASDRASVEQALADAAGESGKLYGLVNSFHFKGNTRRLDTSSNFFAGFADYPEEAWDLVHDVNLKGSFLMSQAALPYLKANGGGAIVNVSSTYGNVSANKSIYGESGINSPVAYATSKAALINLTRYLATHLAEDGIRCNTLSPGGVANNQSEEFVRNYTTLTPLKRMAEATDYQGAIAYLMSDASAYMTGANLIVDGGWTAW